MDIVINYTLQLNYIILEILYVLLFCDEDRFILILWTPSLVAVNRSGAARGYYQTYFVQIFKFESIYEESMTEKTIVIKSSFPFYSYN